MTRQEVRKFLIDFKYDKHEFKVRFLPNGIARITGTAWLKCADTGKKVQFSDSRDMNYASFSEFELLNYMRNWLLNMAIHENDEKIRYKGKKLYDPHKVWSHLFY
jgi:hypothetical protein